MFEQASHMRRSMEADQSVPFNMYVTESHDLVIIAPMPGLAPDDLDINVAGSALTIAGRMRGPHQQDRDYLVHEWTYGPYRRSIELPFAVDGERANATLGNGVLVVSLPQSPTATPHRIQLKQVGTVRGESQGHSGHHTQACSGKI